MPWSNNHLPKYRKHRACGQAVVTLNGRDFYLGPHNTKASKITYDRLVAEWLQNSRNPLVTSSDGITVVEICARYWKYAKGYYQKDGSCTGETPNIRVALRLLREWYGKTPAAEFGPLALKTLRQRMIDADHSRSYVNSQVGRIKRMFKWAVAEELIPPSVSQGLSAVVGLRAGRSEARETDPVLPVDDQVVDRTLSWMGPKGVVALKQWQSEHRWSPNQLRHAVAKEVRKQIGLEARRSSSGIVRPTLRRFMRSVSSRRGWRWPSSLAEKTP